MRSPPSRRVTRSKKLMYYVYILISLKDFTLYTGFSSNIKKRIEYHDKGLCQSTRHKRPVKLIYCEIYITEKDARTRERFLKSGRGRETIKKQLACTLNKYKNSDDAGIV